MLPIYKQRFDDFQRGSVTHNIANGKVVIALRHISGTGNLFDQSNIQKSFEIILNLFEMDDNNERKCVGKAQTKLAIKPDVS